MSLARFVCFACLFSTLLFGGVRLHAQRPDACQEITFLEEEAFLSRRIAEFWKDEDYQLVKNQIIDFFTRFPQNKTRSYFLGMLGDIYLQEEQFEQALAAYDQLDLEGIDPHFLLNKLHCYYALENFSQVVMEGETQLAQRIDRHERLQENDQELLFLVGDALFRQALLAADSDLQQQLARRAQTYLNEVIEPYYAKINRFSLARIYALLGQSEQGANAYLDLAETELDNQEDLLFQAALLQQRFSPSSAISTFTKVIDLNGKRLAPASFNLMTLYFQTERYQDLLQQSAQFAQVLLPEEAPTFHFLMAASLFHLDRYEEAADTIKQAIQATKEPTESFRDLLLMAINIAKRCQDRDLFALAFHHLNNRFAQDPTMAKALFLDALFLKEGGEYEQAYARFQEIETHFQSMAQQFEYLFEYALTACEMHDFYRSQRLCHELFTSHAEHDQIGQIWQLFVTASLELYHSEQDTYLKPQLYRDLRLALSQNDRFDAATQFDYQLLAAKLAYQLSLFDETVLLLEHSLTQTTASPVDLGTQAHAHLLLALALREASGNPHDIQSHLEQAFKLDPTSLDDLGICLEIYNSYIYLSQQQLTNSHQLPELTSLAYLERAAYFLYQAFSRHQAPIDGNNLLWLSDYYFQRTRDHLDRSGQHSVQSCIHCQEIPCIERSGQLYETLLLCEHDLDREIGNPLLIERAYLRYGELLEEQSQHHKRIKLLASLIEKQTEQSDIQWKSKMKAIFELAKSYQAAGKDEEALETYCFIDHAKDPVPIQILLETRLEIARLSFQLLAPILKHSHSPEMVAILNNLKDLQLLYCSTTEQVHLDAALEYIEIRAQLASHKQDDVQERHLFFLTRMEEFFDHHEETATHTQPLLPIYMQFIQAEKWRLQVGRDGAPDPSLHEQACLLYRDIQDNRLTPPSLLARVKLRLKAVRAISQSTPSPTST